jgi:P-type Ca2+ transporter type 2C
LLDRSSVRFVIGVGSMKALLGLGLLGLLPLLGYSLEITRAAAFHFMAVGQLVLTYPSRHTWMRPLANPYLHAAVVSGIGIQVAAASLPVVSNLLGNAAIPLELWGVVFGGALVSWGLAEKISRFVWGDHLRTVSR